MTTAKHPPVSSLVPHEGAMVLLSRIVAHDDKETICQTDPETLALFHSGDRVGAWVGIEVMAQCVAAHAGMLAHRRGELPRIGFLLGSRRVNIHQPWMQGTLGVRALRNWGEESGLVSFDCALWEERTGSTVAAGRLNCFLPSDAELQEMPR